MSKYVVNGGVSLKGEISVHGAKNFALKIIAASLLSNETITIKNIPFIEEINKLLDLMESVGAKIEKNDRVFKISTKEILTTSLDPVLVNKIRSAILLVGPILAKKGEVKFPHPGGCAIGQRPIDFFIEGFKKMGAKVSIDDKNYHLRSPKGLQGCAYFFPKVSHTGTESMMMTAVLAKGKTVLKNAACEPEIVALANYLNACGAKITGAGTHTVTIEGVSQIGAQEVTTIADRVEAGSFAIIGALAAKDLLVKNCEPEHLEALWNMFDKIGVNYELGKDFVRVNAGNLKNYQAVNVTTHEYPGFATDLQPPFTVLLTQCHGLSIVQETIFEGRLFYTDIVNQMGAKIIMCDPYRVVVNGPSKLYGRYINSPDLRAGFALVIAALIAEKESKIGNIYQIDRGYESLDVRLKNLGADIERQED